MAADEWATVAVRDFGIGLAASDQARVFEPLVRLGERGGGAPGGLGLGQYLANELAELQGGRPHIESQSGKGAISSDFLRLPSTARRSKPQWRSPDRDLGWYLTRCV